MKLYRQSVFVCAHVDADVCDLHITSWIPRFYTKVEVYRSRSSQQIGLDHLALRGPLPDCLQVDVNTNQLVVSFTSIYICSIALPQLLRKHGLG